MDKKRITAKKYMGDDAASWAVFLDGRPVVTGLYQREVSYHRKRIQELVEKKENNGNGGD